MKRLYCFTTASILSMLAALGCSNRVAMVNPPNPLGTEVDQTMMQQEINAEAAKFVVYMHEFELNKSDANGLIQGWRLNEDGEDHLKQIAQGIRNGANFPIVVERSRSSSKPDTQYEFPVHLNDELDGKRRMVVVAVLERMGVTDADQRVVVAPAFSQPYTGIEASRAYNRALNMGGGFGGFGGGGGFGSGGSGGGGFGVGY